MTETDHRTGLERLLAQGRRLVPEVVREAYAAEPFPPATRPRGRGPRGRRRRWRGVLPFAAWLLALVLFLTGIPDVAAHTDWSLLAPLLAPLFAFLYASPAGICVRRPLRAWTIVAGTALVGPVLVHASDAIAPWPATQILGAVVVFFAVALRYPLPVLAVVYTLTVADLTVASAAASVPVGQYVPGLAFGIAALMTVGYLIGTRQRSDRRREEEEQRSALLEERARIARELHDVVAHHMSVIAVQAETAPFRIEGLPEAGRACLAEISSTARESLAEMRRLLSVLRSEDGDPEHAPQPGLDRLDALLDGARRTGLRVEEVTTGDPRPLPPGVSMSAYRIVQEALSNVLRHAPGAEARVEVHHEPDLLRLRVTNTAPPGGRPSPRSDGRGHGQLGMRERVGMFGGQLSVGPDPDGGYTVAASLPLTSKPAEVP